MLNFGIASTV